MSIKILDSVLASRIAAGEVIQRPASAVRETLDNAIDSGADHITLSIKDGGISSIRIADNGCGMSKEDLELCFESHATSKISTNEDLYNITTLGFRGEALYSIAACSRLSIESGQWKTEVDNSVKLGLSPSPVSQGTVVTVLDLFDKIPARKEFLKRPAAEAAACKAVLVEKALAFPSVRFTFINDDRQVLDLFAADAKKRVLDTLVTDRNFDQTSAVEYKVQGEGYSLYGVSGSRDVYKADRSAIKVFVNGHCVDDFSLISAITNAFGEFIPGGRFPYFYLFIKIDPHLVDFNIHPSKRECKIRIAASVHSGVTAMIREALKPTIPVYDPSKFQSKELDFGAPRPVEVKRDPVYRPEVRPTQAVSEPHAQLDRSWLEKAKSIVEKKAEPIVPDKPDWTYLGQAFKLFLVVEKDDELWFIDQHAAHERILYDKFKTSKKALRLLVPHQFETSPEVDDFLQESSALYQDYGIELARLERMKWELETLPALDKSIEDAVVQLICESTGDFEELDKKLFAIVACHSAIKAGDLVDPASAIALIQGVMALESPVCPHGRLFVTRIRKLDLAQSVGRFDI